MKAQANGRRSAMTAIAMLMVLPTVRCGGGGGSDSPAPTPAPAPTPTPPPPPPPPAIPPLAPASALNDGRQIGEVAWPNGATATGGQGQPIANLTCGAVPTGFHGHAHLSIFVNGVAKAIPANIGIVAARTGQAACDYPLHTHDLSGMLHMHALTRTVFTLGQFFTVWGQTLSTTNIAGFTGLPVVVYITDNNTASTTSIYSGDLAAIEFIPHREVTIQIGSAISAIPNYTWTGD
jgi:hypothetical protein